MENKIPLTIKNVYHLIHPLGPRTYSVLLQDDQGRTLRAQLSELEANSIVYALNSIHGPRLQTPDVMLSCISSLGGRIEEACFYEVKRMCCRARLHLYTGDRLVPVEMRPGDAINLAIRARRPIYVASEAVMVSAVEEDQRWLEAARGTGARLLVDSGKPV